MKLKFWSFFILLLVLIIFSAVINAEKAGKSIGSAESTGSIEPTEPTGSIKPTEASELNFNLSCDECHANAALYPKHLQGYTYCEECHGGEVHTIHSFDCKTCHQNEPLTPFCHGADPDVLIPTANGLICKACHESNLISVHEDCQLCHQNINEIHKNADVIGGVGDV
ncbi:MAG: hypothetical protein H0Z28_05100 [Archaeoglobus sp.]|nr:hypothetical protein [Archaeoglobus sp.]